MKYLLDTGYLYALLNRKETTHKLVVEASNQIQGQILLPTPVTTEVAYLLLRDLGSEAVAKFAEILATNIFLLVEPSSADYSRAAEIIRKYHDSQVDFVDAVLVAIAERLDVSHILTLDQWHFRIFRPRHIPAFEISP